jgi:rare lipoprotein A
MVATALLAAGCAGGPAPEPRPVSVGWTQEGIASWYGGEFQGRPTASGERYDQEGMTAAHRHLPFGTWVRVENLDNGRQVLVRITDRGPFVEGRVVDLTRAAAREIGMLGPGTARVRIVVVDLPPRVSCREVQVGSFRHRENARSLEDRLWDRGAPARLEDGPEGMIRVVLGPYPDPASARRAVRSRARAVRTPRRSRSRRWARPRARSSKSSR